MQLSRREFLGLSVAGLGAVGACLCGGLGAAWALTRTSNEPSLQAAPFPTSAANRGDLAKQMERPAIISRVEWGGLEPNHNAENENGFYNDSNNEGWRVYEGDLRAIYKTLVVHHSVVDEGDDILSLLAIQDLHRSERAWADVAYHYFIGAAGAIYEGRSITARGTHVAGYNTGSVGVCLIGNFMETIPSPEQLSSLNSLGLWLSLRLNLSHLAGHRDFNNITVCPGDNVYVHLVDLAAYTGLAMGTGGYDGPLAPSPTPEGSSYGGLCPCCHI